MIFLVLIGQPKLNIYTMQVYLISSEIGDQKLYKIGFTSRTVEDRINEFKTGNASDFFIVYSFQSKWSSKIEARIHAIFKSKRVRGEWFLLEKEDIFEFRRLCEVIHNMLDVTEQNNTYYIDRVCKIKQT